MLTNSVITIILTSNFAPPDITLRAIEAVQTDGTTIMTIFADAREVTPDDRYVLDEGQVFMTGTQALVRVILDQMRADRSAGLDTGTMVSGYPGSPLGGFDQELARSHKHAGPLGVVHRPGQNEGNWAPPPSGQPGLRQRFRPRKAGACLGVLGTARGPRRGRPGGRRVPDDGKFVGAHTNSGLIGCCAATTPRASPRRR